MQVGELNIPKIEIEPFSFVHDFHTRIYDQYAEMLEKTELGKSIVKTLSEDPRVIALEDKMLSRGDGAARFAITTLAIWFLWCANENGVASAEQYLDSFLNSEKISVLNTLWVSGIEVDEPIILGDGYAIQPATHMPDSRDKEYFLQIRSGPPRQRMRLPACAITKTCQVQKTIEAPFHRPADQEFWNAREQLYEIAMLLNALSGISCLPYYSSTYVDPTTPLGPFGGSGGGSPIYDVLSRRSTKLKSEAKSTIESLLAKYRQSNDGEKMRIQRILDRLSQAKRREQIEDKILDLGVALEMLLLDDNHNNDQLSLTFRLRGSWLTGQSAEDRVEKYQLLKEIYSYRSQVAHSGILKVSKIKNVRQSFPQYQSLAEDICQKLMLDGKPDWDKLVLGAI